MIKKITSLVALAAIFTTTNAQTTDIGGPVSLNHKTQIISAESVVEMPSFDMEAVMQANAANELTKVGPYMFGYEHQVNMDLNSSGEWSTLANGDRIWRLQVKSAGALSLNFVFSDFFIPEGANLHLYNLDRTSIVGAHTSANNNVNNELGTDLIKGEECIIEYYEPKNVLGQGRLLLTMVVHGYRDINNFYNEKGLNDSGGCNMDVLCPDGSPWVDQIRSVARIVNGGGVCTGTLVNNTAEDGTPYFLTADHCSPQSMGSYVFQFNYTSPSCGSQTSANSTSPSGSTSNNVNGSVKRSQNGDSDFGLLELNAIPNNPYYSGWDNSGDVPTLGVSIHHPSGDVKKISFDDDVLQSANFGGAQTWRIEEWERLTTTEPGSSGSGLWDQNFRLVGQLYGGSAYCGNGNSVNDYYGKFSTSWDGNGSSSSAERLSDWLDPQNTGATTVDGFGASALSVNDHKVLKSEDFDVYPNPTSGELNITNDSDAKIMSIEVLNALGEIVLIENNITSGNHTIDLNNISEGVYFVKLNTNEGISIRKVIKK